MIKKIDDYEKFPEIERVVKTYNSYIDDWYYKLFWKKAPKLPAEKKDDYRPFDFNKIKLSDHFITCIGHVKFEEILEKKKQEKERSKVT